ncbi:MAG: hypothetical protein P8Y61_14705 [Gammaproteobacteria bacterium]|jgi:hypothetical protein
MSESRSTLRVVIAVTETSPLMELWDAALKLVSDSRAELVVLFLHDERWHRAASLPFTREFPMSGGAETDFTPRRAEQLLNETASRLRRRIEELAVHAGLKFAFQVISEQDPVGARTLLGNEISAVVGPSVLANHPVFVELQCAKRQLVLIESTDSTDNPG